MNDAIKAFAAVQRLAPVPTRREDATYTDWIRTHAATGLAAHVAFCEALKTLPRNPERGSRPDLGYLTALVESSVAAACALEYDGDDLPGMLWDLTPEAGSLNGEYIDWLAETIDRYGINPAAIDPAYDAGDFKSAMPEKA